MLAKLVEVSSVDLADSDTEGVGGVVGSWDIVEVQEDANHLLYLFLRGLAVPNHGLLDFRGAEFANRAPRLGGSEGQDAACLGYGYSTRDVLREIQLLDAYGIGFEFLEKPPGVIIKGLEATREMVIRWRGNHAVGYVGEAVPRSFYHAVTGGSCAGVEAENPHRSTRPITATIAYSPKTAAISSSEMSKFEYTF